MKILHCCLANFYIDDYSYQENILPKMHKLQGHEVRILASTETYIDNKNLGYVKASSYMTSDGIPITRLPYKRFLPHVIMKKIRMYEGILDYLLDFKPDLIFIHDTQFLGVLDIIKYLSKHKKTRVLADGHADFIKHAGRNTIINWFSQKVLHGILYKWTTQKINPYTEKFYGVLPVRVDFIKQVYNIPKHKVELLVMGADDTKFDINQKERIKIKVRKSNHLNRNDFLIVTGGKIDSTKKIEVLMQAVVEMSEERIKLLVFGKADDYLKDKFELLSKSNKIIDIGWINSTDVYSYFMAADLVFFPGTHSVLWEQAVGAGAPCVFKRWEGVEHVDVGGNCIFIEKAEVNEIKDKIRFLYKNPNKLKEMERIAKDKGVPYFSYFEIAKRSIN